MLQFHLVSFYCQGLLRYASFVLENEQNNCKIIIVYNGAGKEHKNVKLAKIIENNFEMRDRTLPKNKSEMRPTTAEILEIIKEQQISKRHLLLSNSNE